MKAKTMREPGRACELESATKPSDGQTVPQRVVLRRNGLKAGEWATRMQNMQTGEEWGGNYFPANEATGGSTGAFRRAFRDYVRRCNVLGVDPMPNADKAAPAVNGARVLPFVAALASVEAVTLIQAGGAVAVMR